MRALRGVFRLQSKNYANPMDRGRFGFSMSGEYRAPYRTEGLFIAILIGVLVAAGVALGFVMASFVKKSKLEEGAGSSFVIVGGAIALVVFVVIVILVFGVGIKSIKKGFVCKYTANDETFTATVGGDLHVIRYAEVSNINFKPRSSFGKIRGYDVVIKVKGRDEYFSVCSGGNYLSPQATPFYIIQERVDIQRRSKGGVQENTLRADSRGITRAEMERAKTGSLNAMDRMAQLLGETSNMPELSAGDSPSARAVAEVEKMMKTSSDGMLSVGEDPRRSYYTDDTGRQQPMESIQTQGSFYIKPSVPFLLGMTLLIMAISGGIIFGVGMILIKVFVNPDLEVVTGFGKFIKDHGTTALLILALAIQPFVIYFCVTRIHGPLYNYTADGRGFYMTVKGKGQEQIFYKDVLSVDYSRTRILWGKRGYNVDILTTYGPIHFDYIFPRFNQSIALKNLPFDIIKRNIRERDDNTSQ